MQGHLLNQKVSTRRVQLLVAACGDLIWKKMTSQARTAFKALRQAAESVETPAQKKRLADCGPLKEWLDWCMGIGGRTPELHEATVTLVREVFGNPFCPVTFNPAWRTDTALSLAQQMYESRDFGAMPILADALQDAGCDNDDVLSHCRDANQVHVRGCWVVDLVLGKE
jgi:hypothetical protein